MFEQVKKYLIYAIIFCVIIVFLVLNKNIGCARIDSNSPRIGSLKSDDVAYLDRVSLDDDELTALEYSNVLLYRTPNSKRKHFIGRLVGKPGDRINIKKGKLIRNGEKVFEKYIDSDMKFDLPEIFVPRGTVYLLADRRLVDKNDSRKFGPISILNILGKVTNADEN
ncbi:MAG: signal peptidase I [Planctomycetes bacterium]|nr:signal peptidase I [Planctomycetota bacterium]